jgi:predicted DNA-binding WGR domain protein
MSSFETFLHQRLESSGFTTEDALASYLPLLRQVVAAHRAGRVAPLQGVNDLQVEGVRLWFEEAKLREPVCQTSRVKSLEQAPSRAVEVVGVSRWTAEVDAGEGKVDSLLIAKRGDEITRPVYLPGYLSWEHEIGHHDPQTDVFVLGLILVSLVCGLDLNDPDDLAEFVRHRRNLFELNPALHPVLAKAAVRMTELSRHRRPQDLAAVLRCLENYRDQDVDFEFDLARMRELRSADPRGRHEMILGRLQQRLFEISRRNRLLHFRPTMQTVNLTLASVPLSFEIQSIRPEQILTWNAEFQQAVVAGKPIALNKYLRFEEAIYLPSVLDQIRNEARRDQTEFGFAQLRLVICFLRWSNLKEKPPERFDSPLVLLPVQLTKTKGVRDVYALEPLSTEAEVNPVLRHYLKQLYAIELPEQIDLATTSLDTLYEALAAKIQSSEPAVAVERIDRPRIQLIHARARRRLDQYRRRARLSGRGIRSFLDVDYSYDSENFHPLGLRLFQTRVCPPQTHLRSIVEESPRPRSFMTDPTPPVAEEKERQLYTLAEEETNPYRWEFDLCSVTLGNLRYRKMSLVRDYSALLENGTTHPAFDALVSLSPRPAAPAGVSPPTLEESYAIVPCDPTQASAIALARTGAHYIIQGPPGTGKSQTITNLIADYVSRGKRVLFVCEKRAAIDVVYHRLHQTGLDRLCCLIHDSQADKKEFIMDLRSTYEDFLGDEKRKDTAEQSRQKLLTAMKQELAPLQRFDEAMRAAPAQAGLPLRRLFCRALELRPELPELSPREQERVPQYGCWEEHRARLGRIAAILEDLQGSTVLAKHPLRLLSSRVPTAERPLEFVADHLEQSEKLLETLTSRVDALGLQASEAGTLQRLLDLIGYAGQVQFLAERRQLSLLQSDSELARKVGGLRQAHEAKARELAKAGEATKAWRHKLSPAETQTALEQAREFERSVFSIFKPAWWRLRRALTRCYDFRTHAIKPKWSQVLEGLEREHRVQAAMAEVTEQARGLLGFEGTFNEYLDRFTLLAGALTRMPPHVQAFHGRQLAAGEQTILQIAEMRPLAEELDSHLAAFLEGGRQLSIEQLRDELGLIEESLDDLPDFLPCLAELSALPDPLAEALRGLPWTVSSLEAAMAGCTLTHILRSDRALARHSGQVRARHVSRLEEAYQQFHVANAAIVQERVRRQFLEHVRIASLPQAQLAEQQVYWIDPSLPAEAVPATESERVAHKKELKARYNRGRRELEHEFGKTMRYRSIRDLVGGDSGLVVRDLKPVWLMSPVSVSDTLPLEVNYFDVVIFDEASQVTLEEAVPAIWRARQVIVVGDEMQLPPTSFFSARQGDDDERLTLEDDDGDGVAYELGGDSFLNHAARNLPATMLGWHYRSRSESLISFSNAAFYDGRLLTVPEAVLPAPHLQEIVAETSDEGFANAARLLERPVSFHLLSHGVYEQRRNRAEADYIAQLVRGLLLGDTELSIGIVAFSEAQQGEIEDALQESARTDAEFRTKLEAAFEREQDGQFIGLLVKNLENIQGDERDVVILSVCYGPGPNGKMLMNFGPINQSGGERRLNVAFSRAKQHMAVVSSIRHHAITNDFNDGARCLKNYLRYAEAVSIADMATAHRVLRDMQIRAEDERQECEQDRVAAELAAALRQRGYHVDGSVGQSNFRCDLAVRREGDRAYGAAVLVDTDAHYQRTDVLERDVLRPRLLRGFGWRVAHVLTKDWYEDREAVLNGLERTIAGEAVEATEPPVDAADPPPVATLAPPEATLAPLQSAEPRAAPTSPSADWKRYFEFVGDGSRKFWEITVHGVTHTVRFGRLGSSGQTKTKTFSSPASAEADAQRLVKEKLAKGYLEKTA